MDNKLLRVGRGQVNPIAVRNRLVGAARIAQLGSFSAPLAVMQRDFAAEFIRGDSVGVGVREFGQGLGS
jgi:hypothetical protein